MTDTYGGALAIPLTAPAEGSTVGDPAISIFADFFKAVLNANAPIAWTAVMPPVVTATKTVTYPVVRTVLTHDPREIEFSEADLPALYMDRTGGKAPIWQTEDWRVSPDTWTLLWVFPNAVQAKQKLRNSITNALAKIIDRAVERTRDPAYVAAGDPDPRAASIAADPDAIKTSIAGSTATESYGGADLNGVIGVSAFAPARVPSVTVSGTAGSIADGSVVTWTGLDANGDVRISRATLSAATGTYYGDWPLVQITTIDVDPQAGLAALLEFGLAETVGLGSYAMGLAGLQQIDVTGWKDIQLVIAMGDAPVRTYAALEVTFEVVEQLTEDTSSLGSSSAQAQFVNSDGSLRMTALYP